MVADPVTLVGLSTVAVASNIPRGDGQGDETWTFPSPQVCDASAPLFDASSLVYSAVLQRSEEERMGCQGGRYAGDCINT